MITIEVITGILIGAIIVLVLTVIHLRGVAVRRGVEIDRIRKQENRLKDLVDSYSRSLSDLTNENQQLKKDVIRAVNTLKSKTEDYKLALEFEKLKNLSK